MGREVRRESFWAQNRWALPLLLAVLIAVVVAGAILAPRIKSATSSPTATPTPAATATPQQVVVTATSGSNSGGTATPTAAGGQPPTATPSNSGAATPLPSSSPIPTRVGVKTGMIARPQNVVSTIQAGADAGNASDAYYLDPRQVVQRNLPTYGFTQGFQITSPQGTPTPAPDQSGRPTVKFLVKYQNQTYQVSCSQTGKQGPKGIWNIVTILPQGSY